MQTPIAKPKRFRFIPTLIPLCVIAALAIIAYSNSFQAAFTFDDYSNFAENPAVQVNSLSYANLKNAATQEFSEYRWLPNISFALNYYFNGLDLRSYHLVNLVIHIMTAITFYYLIIATLSLPLFSQRIKNLQEIALVAALIWTVHPVQTNAVTYIVQRMTSMATLFYLCTLLCYVKARIQPQAQKKFILYAISVFAALLAMTCKENSAMLLFMVPAYDFFFLRQPGRPINYKKILGILTATAIVFLALGWIYMGTKPLSAFLYEYGQRNFTLGERLLTESRVIFHYLSLIVFPLPSRLNLNYDYQISHSLLAPPQTLLAVLGIIALISLIPFLYKRERLLSFAILFFLANLAIESTVIPLEIIYEHRLYLPSVFLFVTAAAFLYRFCQNRIANARVAVLVLVCLLTAFTWQRNTVWENEITLWSDVVEKSPNLTRAYVNLGKAYEWQENYKEAEKLFKKAIELEPENGLAYANLGIIYEKLNHYEEALQFLNKALTKKHVSYASVHNDLGIVYWRLEDYRKSIAAATLALKMDPNLLDAYVTMAISCEDVGWHQKAFDLLDTAYRKGLKTVDLYVNWGKSSFSLGMVDKSIQLLKRAVELAPNHPAAHHNLAVAYRKTGLIEKSIQEENLARQLWARQDKTGRSQ